MQLGSCSNACFPMLRRSKWASRDSSQILEFALVNHSRSVWYKLRRTSALLAVRIIRRFATLVSAFLEPGLNPRYLLTQWLLQNCTSLSLRRRHVLWAEKVWIRWVCRDNAEHASTSTRYIPRSSWWSIVVFRWRNRPAS